MPNKVLMECWSSFDWGRSTYRLRVSINIWPWMTLVNMTPPFWSKTTMGDKRVETIVNKINFRASWTHFPPSPPKQCWFFHLFDCTDHSAYTALNWGAHGISELTLHANKIEQVPKHRKASFPKSFSATLVAHCSCKFVTKGEEILVTEHLSRNACDHISCNFEHCKQLLTEIFGKNVW